jgi:hypothetical protein
MVVPFVQARRPSGWRRPSRGRLLTSGGGAPSQLPRPRLCQVSSVLPAGVAHRRVTSTSHSIRRRGDPRSRWTVVRVSAAQTVQPAGVRRRAMSLMRGGCPAGDVITGRPSESCARRCSPETQQQSAGRIENLRSTTRRVCSSRTVAAGANQRWPPASAIRPVTTVPTELGPWRRTPLLRRTRSAGKDVVRARSSPAGVPAACC